MTVIGSAVTLCIHICSKFLPTELTVCVPQYLHLFATQKLFTLLKAHKIIFSFSYNHIVKRIFFTI